MSHESEYAAARNRLLAALDEHPPQVSTELADRYPAYAGDLFAYRPDEPALPPLLALTLVAADLRAEDDEDQFHDRAPVTDEQVNAALELLGPARAAAAFAEAVVLGHAYARLGSWSAVAQRCGYASGRSAQQRHDRLVETVRVDHPDYTPPSAPILHVQRSRAHRLLAPVLAQRSTSVHLEAQAREVLAALLLAAQPDRDAHATILSWIEADDLEPAAPGLRRVGARFPEEAAAADTILYNHALDDDMRPLVHRLLVQALRGVAVPESREQ